VPLLFCSNGGLRIAYVRNLFAEKDRWLTFNDSGLLGALRFELVIAVYLLYGLLGWSLVAGLAVFAILVPIQTKMAGFLNGYQDDQLKWMDSRLRLMTEILTNIRIVKLYNW